MDLDTLRNFVNWALTKHKLSCNSTKVYLSDFFAHNLCGFKTDIFNDFFVKSMLKGAENLALYTNLTKRTRLIMTLPLLKILGHDFANSSWPLDSKRVFWAACCLAFFGSFRMCEILMSSEKHFSADHLTWDRVNFSSSDYATIQIGLPKINKFSSGDFIDIFKIGSENFCPHSCLWNLKKAKKIFVEQNLPVFTFDNGSFLTTDKFSKTIRVLLQKHLGSNAKLISGHSFRAGIPSAIANSPSLLSNDDVCKWGRWNSDCFKSYTRLKISARREIFKKLFRAVDK
jgi:hypothetical protein